MLKDCALCIRQIVAHHIVKDIEDLNDSDGDDDDDEEEEDVANNDAPSSDATDKPESINDIIVTIVQDAGLLTTGGIAGATALEPRIRRIICQCAPPADIVGLLLRLTEAVNNVVFSTLALRVFSKAGFQELQTGGLKEMYTESSSLLDQCANSLAKLEKPGDDVDSSNLPFDPIMIKERTVKVEQLTNEWIDTLKGPIDRSKSMMEKSSRKLYLSAVKPWIMGAGIGLIYALVGCFVKAFSRNTWKRILLPPYYDLLKFVWALKFALGFTLLIIMYEYWPAFANFELETKDDLVGSYFFGWVLIAYAFSTTQTVEGTMKKSLLRAVGTAAGGFSAWLALTACNGSAIGLGAWLTVTNTIAAYLGLPQGFCSRFGLDKDLAWGPAYFAMTNSLVVMEVYMGYGGKNDITANRIVSNLAGILMSVVMALIPPGVYGTSPREAKFLLEDNKRVFRDCIELMLNGSSSDVEELHRLHAVAKEIFMTEFSEVNDNYNDAADQLKGLCIYKPNPKFKIGLGHLAVLGSTILSLVRLGIIILELEPQEGGSFSECSKERNCLIKILESLDIEDDIHKNSAYHIHKHAREGKSHKRPQMIAGSLKQSARAVPIQTTFCHLCIFITHYLVHREIKLDSVYYGMFGKKSTGQGRRTKIPPGHLLSLSDDDSQIELKSYGPPEN